MKNTILLVVVIFSLISSPAFSLTTDNAVNAMRKGDFKTAINELRVLVEKNDPNAQFLMGMLYDAGNGVPQDQSVAATWYRKAAEQNHTIAQLFLGVFYYNGIGVEKDYKEAVRWFQSPALKGNDQAQFYLGMMYASGHGLGKDDSAAIEWLAKAAVQKNTRAMGLLSTLLFSRNRDEKDLIDAYVWSHIAAKYDPVQAATTARFIIEKYCTEAQKKAGNLSIIEWENKWKTDSLHNRVNP
ncbi:MAG: sel1 repeat family protein [Gammaproteobacteria bacterium]|nr:sel1 repeat family protein [Gammaproteobacteria bacterium]MDH5652574.1 sel1 repeat family protein [Gammaproteobacteria bacterium]